MYQLLDVYAYVPPLAHAFQRHMTALGTPTNPYVYVASTFTRTNLIKHTGII